MLCGMAKIYIFFCNQKNEKTHRDVGRKTPELLCCILPFFFFFFLVTPLGIGILVPQLGIEPALPELEAQSLKHQTAREVLIL